MIYLDANIFLNPILYEDTVATVIPCKKLFTQLATKSIQAYTAFLTWDEIVYICKREYGQEFAAKQGNKFLNFPSLIFIKINKRVMSQAQKLIESYNIRPRDAIHIGCMQSKGIKTIVSYDSDFDKIPHIIRKTPETFLKNL